MQFVQHPKIMRTVIAASAALLLLSAGALPASADDPSVPKMGIIRENGGFYYYENGTLQTKVGFQSVPLPSEGTGTIYITSRGGKLATGFFRAGNSRYYAAPSDALVVRNTLRTISGQKYWFSNNGSLKSSRVVRISGKAYLTKSNGALRTASRARYVTMKKRKYFVYPSGRVIAGVNRTSHRAFFVSYSTFAMRRKSGWFRYGKMYYRAKKGGTLYRGKFRYYGTTISANKDTGAISASQYRKAMKAKKNWKATYVVIDISSQSLKYVRNGKTYLRSSVVTGGPGHRTPRGTYHLLSKGMNVNLVGRDYISHVTYWMPFIGCSYGMHDANWRSSFGGSIYQWNGSHGCVNMPYFKAQKLYNHIRVGTKIIIKR